MALLTSNSQKRKLGRGHVVPMSLGEAFQGQNQNKELGMWKSVSKAMDGQSGCQGEGLTKWSRKGWICPEEGMWTKDLGICGHLASTALCARDSQLFLQPENLGESADDRDQDISPKTAEPSKGRQNKAPHPPVRTCRDKTHRKRGPVGGSWLRLGTLSLPMPSRDRCPASMVITSDHAEAWPLESTAVF